MMKKLGFTLAEVLIVLGIIGVISVLTLPNVMADHKKKTFTTQLQRFYNQLNNAISKYKYENNIDELSEGDITTSEGTLDFLQKNFKVTKLCNSAAEYGDSNLSECFADNYYTVQNKLEYHFTNVNDDITTYECVVLDTGASVCMKYLGETDNSGSSDDNVNKDLEIIVDLNGVAGPNIIGRDYFNFYVFSDGVIAGTHDLGSRAVQSKNCGTSGSGTSCFDTITGNNWVMDY